MALVTSVIPNYINGVSQQPPHIRFPNQVTEQVNCLSSPVDGLQKRPPTEFVTKVSSSQYYYSFCHSIVRDNNEQYFVILPGDGSYKVVDAKTGENKNTFLGGTAAAYLTAANPKAAFRALTIADYTFIVNREKVTASDASMSAAKPYECLVYVKQGNYGKTYTVTANGVTASYQTPDGSTAAHSNDIATDNIANELYTQFDSSGAFTTVTQYGSTIHLVAASDFTVESSDGYGGYALKIIKDKVQNFSDLPNLAPTGFTVEVVGDPSTDADNYWIKWESDGVWLETIAPNTSIGISHINMPHALIRQNDGTFIVDSLPWVQKKAGDSTTVPFPSFIGRRLNDVFFYRNRLGFLCDENVILSKAGEYYDFFRSTATTLLDDDPIDIAVTHNRVAILQRATVFNEKLILFNELTQFVDRTDGPLTAKTVSIKAASEYSYSDAAEPVGAGQSLFFAFPRSQYEGVRELFVSDTGDLAYDSAEITAHVPSYLWGEIHKLTTSPELNMMCALSSAFPNAVYVYNYLWNRDEKVQSAWHVWAFDDENATVKVIHAEFIQQTLFLLIQRADGLFLEKIRLQEKEQDLFYPFITRMDRKINESLCTVWYESFPDKTHWTTPFDFNGSAPTVINAITGEIIDTTPVNAHEFWAYGDFTGTNVYIGVTYTALVEITPPSVQTEERAGKVTNSGGHLIIRKYSFDFAESYHFVIEVTPKGRNKTYYNMYNGVEVSATALASLTPPTGTFGAMVFSKNTDFTLKLTSTSHLPFKIIAGFWEGTYHNRARRI